MKYFVLIFVLGFSSQMLAAANDRIFFESEDFALSENRLEKALSKEVGGKVTITRVYKSFGDRFREGGDQHARHIDLEVQMGKRAHQVSCQVGISLHRSDMDLMLSECESRTTKMEPQVFSVGSLNVAEAELSL